jgi:predicted enzyme related to lactoylglutathione lyase
MPRARAFYEKTFGLALSRLPNPDVELWGFPMQPEKPGCSGALIKMSGKDSGIGGTLVYFSCADCAVEAARAAENGGRILRAKFFIGDHGYIALVFDTEGNLIGLHSMA